VKALELGCWKKCPETGGYDVTTLGLEETADVNMDVEGQRLPFEDSTFDFIWSHQFFEHISDTRTLIQECYRILKPDGKMEIHTPHYLHMMAWGDPTHKKGFNRSSFNVFDPSHPHPDNYGCRFRVKARYGWFAHTTETEGSVIGKVIHRSMNWLINTFPILYDSWLVFIISPPQECIYELKAIKEEGI